MIMWKLRLLILGLVLMVIVACLAVSDSRALIADTSVPNNEVTSSGSEANNSSASATLTITMTTAPNEQSSQ